MRSQCVQPSWIVPCFAIRLFLFQFLLLVISSSQRVPRKALTDPREERSPALTPVAFSVILFIQCDNYCHCMVNKRVHSPIKFKWLSHLDLIYLEFFPLRSPPNFEVQFSRSITSHTFCWLPIARSPDKGVYKPGQTKWEKGNWVYRVNE